MIVDLDTGNTPLAPHRHQRSDVQFAALMAQYTPPLFSPWPATDQTIRTNSVLNGASLSTHAATSNRREGRHARE